jgi:hypothetical protein
MPPAPAPALERRVRHVLPRPFASQSLRRLPRAAYLATLALLQVALAIDVAPRLGTALVPNASYAHVAGWPSLALVGGHALAIGGAAIVLAVPALALARHARRGRARFVGLPRFGIGLGIAGASIYAAAQAAAIVARWPPALFDAAAAGTTESVAAGGIALMAAGALTAEVLRRSVAPLRIPIAPWHCRPVRIEVIDPPDLATRAG